ncbi:jg25699, partial [Pararge aegeria aegeria]
DRSLWVQNILNRSSGDLLSLRVQGSRMHLPVTLEATEEGSLQSVRIKIQVELNARYTSTLINVTVSLILPHRTGCSIGELRTQPAPALTPPAPLAPEPAHVICIPARLDFVNFTVGRLHTVTITPPGREVAYHNIKIRCIARGVCRISLKGS